MHFGKISFVCTLFFSFLPNSCCDYPEELQIKYFESGFQGSINEYAASLTKNDRTALFPEDDEYYSASLASKRIRTKKFRPLSEEEENRGPLRTISTDHFDTLSHQARRQLLLGEKEGEVPQVPSLSMHDLYAFAQEIISHESLASTANAAHKPNLHTISLSLQPETLPGVLPEVPVDASDLLIDESFILIPDSTAPHLPRSKPFIDDDGNEHFKKHPSSRFTVRTVAFPALLENTDEGGLKETCREHHPVTTSHFYVPLAPSIENRDHLLAACTFHMKHSREKLTFEELGAIVRCLDDRKNEDLIFFKKILKTHATISEVDELGRTILWSLIPYDRNPFSLKKLALLLKAGANATRRHAGNESFIEYLQNPLCSLERTNARAAYECCRKSLNSLF